MKHNTFCLIVLASCLEIHVAAHGHLTKPHSRAFTNVQESGTCAFDRCMWYTNNITIPGPATNVNPKYLTMRVVPGSEDDIYSTHPWRAPGTAPSRSPCGRMGFNHGGKFGLDGRQLKSLNASQVPKWIAGHTTEVAMALTANHGGGYQYRLCKSTLEQSEECFQETPLEFVGNITWIQIADDTQSRVSYPAVRLSEGTIPVGSTWARNPIPNEPNWPEWKPPGGYAWGHQNIPFNIFDKVKIPENLEPGHYTLSWRWDCEQTAQVWANCADVEVVSPSIINTSSSSSLSIIISSKYNDKRYVANLPQGELVWKWPFANAGISGGVIFTGDGSVAFGSFLSTGSASPGYNKTYWAVDIESANTSWFVPVPTAVLYQGIRGDGYHGEDGVIYFGTLGPWIYAVNASTGSVIWRSGGGVPAEYKIPADDYFSAPTLYKNVVLAGNYDNHLYAHDAKTGKLLWRYNAQGPCNGSPAIDLENGIVFFTARFDLLIAVDVLTGKELWTVHCNTLLASPTYYEGRLYVGTQNSTIRCHNSTTGDLIWSISGRVGAVWALNGPPIVDGVAYFGSDDGYMYAINATTGLVLWEFRTGGQIEAAATVESGVVYFGSLDYSVYAVNASTGEGLWSYPTNLYVSCVPAVRDGIVYVGSYDGTLYALKAPSRHDQQS